MADGNLRDRILKAEDLPRVPEQVLEWGCRLYVRTMTGKERDSWEESVVDQRSGKAVVRMQNARASLLVRCIVDSDGKRIFSDADAPALGDKSSKVISRLYNRAADLNGIGEEAMDELVGNSDDARNDASTFGSPETSDTPT